MAKTHELKTLAVYFNAVARGDKTFEIRKNDRDFQTGDTLVLREWDPLKTEPPEPHTFGKPDPLPKMPGDYTGRELFAMVSYVLHDTWGAFGLERGYVVLGLSNIEDVQAVKGEEMERALSR